MRLIGLTCDGDGKPGFASWLEDAARREETIARVRTLLDTKPDTYKGVFFNAGCGRLVGGRVCGENPQGDSLVTFWAGHDEHPIHDVVFDVAAFSKVVVQIGFPETMAGLDALVADAERLGGLGDENAISFDVSGNNTSARVAACMRAVRHVGCDAFLESRPLDTPLYGDETDYVTTAKRARAILGSRGFLGTDMIFYNTDRGANGWNAAEALVHESQGRPVVQPLAMIEGGA
jgi:hypothetical protein